MGELEWTNELVIRLMQEYRARPELWDTAHEMYRVQTLKYETWSELAAMFECDIADLRKKLNSVFASHRREKARVRAGLRSSWFLYPYMSFLPSHLACAERDDDALAEKQVSAKRRKQEQESAASSSSSEGGEDERELLEEVLVKREPVAAPERRGVACKPRLTRPARRRLGAGSGPGSGAGAAEARLAEALARLRRRGGRGSGRTRRRDECDSFGEYIADSLRKHDARTQSMIKQAVNNILFEQEMKRFSTASAAAAAENPLVLADSDADDSERDQ